MPAFSFNIKTVGGQEYAISQSDALLFMTKLCLCYAAAQSRVVYHFSIYMKEESKRTLILKSRGGSNTFNLLGIPNTFKYLYLTSNTKYFQSICIWPQILNTQSCQILFQILVKYFFEKKSIISFQKRANLPPFF